MGTKMGKRLFCFILAFAMVFTTVVTGDFATVQAYGEEYVYFYSDSNLNNSVSSFYGVEGTSVTLYSNHKVHWSIDQEAYARIDGSADGTSVTVNIISAAGTYVTLSGYYYNETNDRQYSNSIRLNLYKPVQITETDLTIKEHYQKTFHVNSQSGEYFTYSLSSLDNVEYVNPGSVTRTWSESVVLKGKAQGNAQLKVTAFLDSDGNKILSENTYTISVTEAPFYLYTDDDYEDQDIAAASYDMSSGNTKCLYYNSDVFGIADGGLVSSNPAVATVEKYYSDGIKIKAVGNGTAVISATNTFGQTASVTINVHTDPTNVSFNQDDYILNLGYSAQTSYTLTPANASGNPEYSSNNTNICVINGQGAITAVGVGSTEIKIKVGNKYDYADVEVIAPSASVASSSIYVGEKTQVSFSGGEGVTWASSNNSIATVDANGVVTGKKKGSVTIVGTSSVGTQASVTITVSNPSLSSTKVSLYLKETQKLKVYGGPGKITWSSSNKKVAKVDKNGKITALKKGTCYIYAKRNGVKLKCKVTVKNPKLSQKKLVTYQNVETFLHMYGGSGKISWKSSNTKVATVNKSGKITAKKTGTCTITAKRNGITLKCKVTVRKNQATFNKSTSPSYYSGVEFVPKKVYYSGNNIVVDAYIVNARYYKIKKLNYINVYVTSASGYTTIASKTYYNYKLNMGARTSKKCTFKITGSDVRDKHYNLKNGIKCYATGQYS